MGYRLLGKSGLRVSEFCLGTMTFGKDWGSGSIRTGSITSKSIRLRAKLRLTGEAHDTGL
jgi:aryl-alcohol dehydrogenase-like predicted oxidoreductase